MDGLSREAIAALLDLGEAYLEAAASGPFKSSRLRGRTIVNLFYEASTRTRTSFEIAGKRLGADVVNVSASTSSASKGESLFDTVANLAAMGADAVVLRHGAAGAPHALARRFPAAIVNAGDGMHEHPTQALLDALTIRRKKGRLADLVVAICGDILHSRVARSNAHLLATMGASVRLAGPRTLLPPALAAARGSALLGATPVEVFDRIEPALQGADVVMMLRVQRERMGGALLPSAREYARTFGLNEARLALAHPEALVMHPGPMNRGVEIDPAVADGPKSAILDQVEAGVAVRTAVLATLLADDPAP